MDEIAESAPDTTLPTVQATTGFAKIGDGRQLAVDGPCGVPAGIERVASFLGTVFVLETRVDVADEVLRCVSGVKKREGDGKEKGVAYDCTRGKSANLPFQQYDSGRGGIGVKVKTYSLLLSQTTTSSISPNLHISHQKSS